MKKEAITVYAVYSNDYSGESAINVFYDESEAYKFMILDMEQVIDSIKNRAMNVTQQKMMIVVRFGLRIAIFIINGTFTKVN